MIRSPQVLAAHDVVEAFPLFRLAGHRPSAVYVDENMKPSASGSDERRLTEPVFRPAMAEPGDQLQHRADGLVLIVGEEVHPVQLSEPVPRDVATAFRYAQQALEADTAIIERLVRDGVLVMAKKKKLRSNAVAAPGERFGEGTPLVATAHD